MRPLCTLLSILILATASLNSHTALASDGCPDPFNMQINPVWSPDGENLLIIARCQDDFDIWMIGVDGPNPVNLTGQNGTTAADWERPFLMNPSFSPDGSQILYASDFLGTADIWLMAADGSNPENLTPDNPTRDWYPCWSPDGTQIAYVSQSENGLDTQINILSLTDHQISTPVAQTHAAYGDLVWSPDGTRLAFNLTWYDSTLENYDDITSYSRQIIPAGVGVLDLASGEITILTTHRDDSRMSWLPDSSGLIINNRSHNIDASGGIKLDWSVWYVTADGSELTNLTDGLPISFNGTVSPDGTRLAFDHLEQPNTDIFVMNLDGTGKTNLTTRTGYNAQPVWSPDGTKIAFSSDGGQPPNLCIWVMDADGSNRHDLCLPTAE